MELCRSPRQWIAAVEDAAYVAGVRTHGRRNLLAVGWQIARSPTRGAARTPGHEAVAAAAEISGRTVTRWITWLMRQGLLGRVSAGRTAAWSSLYRPMALAAPNAANERAVYILCVPATTTSVDESGDPFCTPEVVDIHTRAQDEEPPDRNSSRPPRKTKKDGPTGPATTENPTWPMSRPARTRRERLELIRRLRAESSTLRAVRPRLLRHLLRPWLAADWTAAGVLYALDHASSDVPWTYTWDGPEALRNPAGWVWWRMRCWLDQDGRPLRDEIAAAQLRTNARRRADLERAGRPQPSATPPPADYRAARAALRARRLSPHNKPDRLA